LEVRRQITETYFLHSVKALLYLQFAPLSAAYTPSFIFLRAKPGKWVDWPPDRLCEQCPSARVSTLKSSTEFNSYYCHLLGLDFLLTWRQT
jgi:hypothetical protein